MLSYSNQYIDWAATIDFAQTRYELDFKNIRMSWWESGRGFCGMKS